MRTRRVQRVLVLLLTLVLLTQQGVMAQTDRGDAPAPFPTLSADNGASHAAMGPTIGAFRDTEADGLPTVGADGDDVTDSDDEDGVWFVAVPRVGQPDAEVTVDVRNATNDVKLDAWLDFNADHCWGNQLLRRFEQANK